jgi:hypothetical protein
MSRRRATAVAETISLPTIQVAVAVALLTAAAEAATEGR